MPLYEQVTKHTVSALPEGLCMDAYAWAVEVTYRGKGRWAVSHHGRCFDADGNPDWEPIPSSREDDWLDRFRHTEEEALRIARLIAPRITINGHTPADLLAKYAPRDDEVPGVAGAGEV